MVQAVSSHSSTAKTQQTSETAKVAQAKRQPPPEKKKEAPQASTQVSLGQQGAPASVSTHKSPAQQYASVASIK